MFFYPQEPPGCLVLILQNWRVCRNITSHSAAAPSIGRFAVPRVSMPSHLRKNKHCALTDSSNRNQSLGEGRDGEPTVHRGEQTHRRTVAGCGNSTRQERNCLLCSQRQHAVSQNNYAESKKPDKKSIRLSVCVCGFHIHGYNQLGIKNI